MSATVVRRGGAKDLVAAIESLPPLPAIALRVIHVAQDAKSSAVDLALVVSADPGLSAKILRAANSRAHRGTREVTSVQEALIALGSAQARNVAVSSAIMGSYAPDSLNALFRIELFWRHSLAVALKASDYAARGRRLDIPSAFTAGILHNMGRLAMFYADPEGIDQAVAESIRSGRSLEHVEWETLGFNHVEPGRMLAMKWKLPADICDAIGRHHHDDEPETPTLASVVAQADAFCVAHGIMPGYRIEGPANLRTLPSREHQQLTKQVDELMVLVAGEPAGVKFIP